MSRDCVMSKGHVETAAFGRPGRAKLVGHFHAANITPHSC